MSNLSQNDHIQDTWNSEEESLLNLKDIFKVYFRYWPVVLISIAVGVFLARTYLRYAIPEFQTSMELLLKDNKNSGQLAESAILGDLGFNTGARNIENEISLLTSKSLMEVVVQELGLEVDYYSKGRIKNSLLYEVNPFIVTNVKWKDSTERLQNFVFQIKKISANKWELLNGDEKLNVHWGEPIDLKKVQFSVEPNQLSQKTINGELYEVDIATPEARAIQMTKNLEVTLSKKTSTVLRLAYKGLHPKRAADILNKLVKEYDEMQAEDKNRIYVNTVKFLDERLFLIANDLSLIEQQVQQLKSESGGIDLSLNATSLLSDLSRNTEKLQEIDVQLEVLAGIKKILSNSQTRFEFIPSSGSITNLALTGLITNFNQLLLQWERAKLIQGPNHPDVLLYQDQLVSTRTTILDNLQAIQKELEVGKKSIASSENRLNGKLRSLPVQERRMLEVQRQQEIKNAIYLKLLEKREESAISANVSVSDNKVIDRAEKAIQVKPKNVQIWGLGLFGGAALPILAIMLLHLLNNKVQHEEDVKKKTKTPLLGSITFSPGGQVFGKGKNRSAAAEMFRVLRANLQYVGEGVHNKVIAVTSSVSGEGKSFVVTNLGITLSLGNKKVALLEFDMRKPKLAKYLNHIPQGKQGLSAYLSNPQLQVEDILHPHSNYANLFYIPCGPIPPNPSELILGERMNLLMDRLKDEFDYILVDTPPIGLVGDALLFAKYIDVSLYVVRAGVSLKENMQILDGIYQQQKMPRLYAILNGVKANSIYGKKYGYGYGYGYGYYQEDNTEGFFKKKFNQLTGRS